MMACPMIHGEAAVSMDEMHEHMEEMTKHMEHMKNRMAAMRDACGMEGQHAGNRSSPTDDKADDDSGEDYSHDH